MKKFLIIFLTLFTFMNVYAEENVNKKKIEVSVIECQKANTYMIQEEKNVKRIKLLAFDGSSYNQEALDSYVCNLVNKAKKIEIEYDIEGKDEYNRYPVWVYLDGARLQDKLISEGYGEVNYIENDYNYLNHLCTLQKDAILDKKGIWKTISEEKYCKSGIEIKNDEIKKEKEAEEEKEKNYKYIYYILVINSIMIILLVILRRTKNEER